MSRRSSHSGWPSRMALALAVLLLMPAAASAEDYATLVKIWKTHNEPTLLDKLIEFRDTPYGRCVEVDFMIGTTLCRLPEYTASGRNMLDSILYWAPLDHRSHVIISREFASCGPGKQIPPMIALRLSATTGGTSGKMYFRSLARSEVSTHTSVGTDRQIPLAELEKRRFNLSQASEAKEELSKLYSAAIRRSARAVHSTPHFILFSNRHSADQLKSAGRFLEDFLQYFVAAYRSRPPTSIIPVYVVGQAGKVSAIGNRLHGLQVPGNTLGYSFHGDRSIVAYVPGSGFGTVVHELVHLLIRIDFGDIPPWLDEGLAAAHETTKREGSNRFRCAKSWRWKIFKEFEGRGKRPHLGTLVAMNRRELDNDEMIDLPVPMGYMHHATSKYFVWFLQEKGWLADVYRGLRERNPKGRSTAPAVETIQVLEAVSKKSISSLDNAFSSWLKEKTNVEIEVAPMKEMKPPEYPDVPENKHPEPQKDEGEASKTLQTAPAKFSKKGCGCTVESPGGEPLQVVALLFLLRWRHRRR